LTAVELRAQRAQRFVLHTVDVELAARAGTGFVALVEEVESTSTITRS
jgi:hypothetical protein